MDNKIYNKLIEIIEYRQKAALCIITETKGSTPRKTGSKMIVLDDLTVFGSVGGGELEYFVVQKSAEIIKLQKPKNFNFQLKSDFKMACGGNVSIYIEPVKIPDQLIIFGAGHIGKALASFARKLNFKILIIDERKDIFDSWEKLPEYSFINEIYTKAIEKIIFDEKTYICSATYQHTHDKEIAALCSQKKYAYLGIIASKNKAQKINNFLIEEKKIPAQIVKNIDMPMGIPIACETPEEIAISILAKIIDIRNSKI